MTIQKVEYSQVRELLEKAHLIASSKEYINFCQNYFQAKPHFIGLFQEDKLIAVLPLFETKRNSLIYLETAPKLYTEIITSDSNIQIDFGLILSFLKRNFQYDILDISLYFLNRVNVSLAGFSNKTDVYLVKVKKGMSADDVFVQIIRKKSRNQTRYAYKHNLKKEIKVDLEVFYPLYLKTMNRLGALPKPLQYFKRLVDAFSDKLQIIFAKKDNQVIGANLFVIQGDYLYLMFNISDSDYWQYCLNNFLYWETILYGLNRGVTKFDFGINAKRDSQQKHFKEGFGAQAYPIWRLAKFGSLKGWWQFNKKRVEFLIKILRRHLM